MNNPIEELGKMMGDQMKRINQANKGVTLELGTIRDNMALSVSSLGNAIPKGDYMIALRLTAGSLTIKTSKEEEHLHSVDLPEKMRSLRAGDRVLVAWVGTEPIVVDIVVSS